MKVVNELVREFNQFLNDYNHVYEPDIQLEWSLVLQEIKAFIDAESLVPVLTGPTHPDGNNIELTFSKRLDSRRVPPSLKMPTGKLFLSEALIVGNYQRQVKFSELTIDMYRMLQILEREPEDIMSQQQAHSSPNNNNNQQTLGFQSLSIDNSTSTKPFNLLTRPNFNSQRGLKGSPHKYLLYSPTFSQLFLFLASGFKELPAGGVLLLYLSADGVFGHMDSIDGDELGYDLGGVATNNSPSSNLASQRNRITYHQSSLGSKTTGGGGGGSATGNYKVSHHHLQQQSSLGMGPNQSYNDRPSDMLLRSSHSTIFKQINCLHPGDLYAFVRRPFVLIVDSNNSHAFQHIPRHFGTPLLVFMSPTDYPTPFNSNSKGSLFTLFLNCPLTALCLISNISAVQEPTWREAQFIMDKFYSELGTILLQSRSIDPSYISFCADDFLRSLIFKFIFCFMVMKLHRLFRTCNFYPRATPAIPEVEFVEHPVLRQIISDLTVTLDIRTLFE